MLVIISVQGLWSSLSLGSGKVYSGPLPPFLWDSGCCAPVALDQGLGWSLGTPRLTWALGSELSACGLCLGGGQTLLSWGATALMPVLSLRKAPTCPSPSVHGRQLLFS